MDVFVNGCFEDEILFVNEMRRLIKFSEFDIIGCLGGVCEWEFIRVVEGLLFG